MQATLIAVKGGWHAVGDGWAVFGETEEQALERYQEAERQHAEILSRLTGDGLRIMEWVKAATRPASVPPQSPSGEQASEV